MSDTTSTPATPAAPATPPEGTPPATPPASPPATPETPAPKPEDELPEWAKKELSNVRGEAANYRTRLRDAETKLSAAKTPEEFEAATTELKTENAKLARSLLVRDVAAKHELPAELAAVLVGETEEELAKHAKVLQKFAATPTPPEELNGGLTPGANGPAETNPRKLAQKHGGRRR